MRKKKILAGVVIAAAALALAFALVPVRPEKTAPSVQSAPRASAQAKPTESRLASLPSRDPMTKPRGELFGPHSWTPPPPKVSQAPAPPQRPIAPPVPYRVAGQFLHDGTREIVLSKDDRVFTVREGEMLDDFYKVEAIEKDSVTLVYVPLREKQVIPIASLLEAAPTPAGLAQGAAPMAASAAGGDSGPPAQIRWDGPQSVQAGSNFDVSLKLTSEQPVRSSPLQVSFDAKLLEPVAVRAGEFFSDGKFSYRVNPEGSIFVGGYGDGAAAADAEFVVLTFRPLRSGAAEVKISSIALQGPGGRTIAHEPPAAFRTAIVQ